MACPHTCYLLLARVQTHAIFIAGPTPYQLVGQIFSSASSSWLLAFLKVSPKCVGLIFTKMSTPLWNHSPWHSIFTIR